MNVPLPPASRRICVALDIEGFSGRGNVNHLAMQARLREIAGRGVGHAGVRWKDVEVEEKGDGLLLEMPPGVDEPRVIPALVHGCGLAVRSANATAPGVQRMRLRMALTQGIRHVGATGRVGDAVIAACRLVDCTELRVAFAGYPDRDLGLIVADDLFRDVIAHGYPGLDPDGFIPVEVLIPAKRFAEPAWVLIPEPPTGTLLDIPTGDSAAWAAAASAVGVALGGIAGGLAEIGLREAVGGSPAATHPATAHTPVTHTPNVHALAGQPGGATDHPTGSAPPAEPPQSFPVAPVHAAEPVVLVEPVVQLEPVIQVEPVVHVEPLVIAEAMPLAEYVDGNEPGRDPDADQWPEPGHFDHPHFL